MLSSGRTVSYRSKLYCRVRCDFIVHYVYIERYYSIASYTKANTILYYTFIHSFVHSFIHSYPSFMSFNFMSFVQSYMIFNIYKVNLIESQIKKQIKKRNFETTPNASARNDKLVLESMDLFDLKAEVRLLG